MLELFPSRTIAVSIGDFAIHWYGLMYLFAFLLAFYLIPRLQKYRGLHLTSDEWSSILSWGIVGVLLGGRLGYVLFYEPAHFLMHPLEIFAVWKGGMSSHGGFIGVILALLWATRAHRQHLLNIADVIIVPVALGLMLGRIGNFINLELYGTVTSVSWAIAIPGVEGLRHPTQVYAVIKDLLLAVICGWHLISIKPAIPGQTSALFLMLYSIARFIVEHFRDQPHGYTDLGIIEVSRGQLLTIPIFVFGVILWFWSQKRA